MDLETCTQCDRQVPKWLGDEHKLRRLGWEGFNRNWVCAECCSRIRTVYSLENLRTAAELYLKAEKSQ